MRARIAYLSFDTVPAPKGAATHIEAFARILAKEFGGVELVTVAPGAEVSVMERWPGVRHTELPALGESLIDRVLCFRRFLTQWLRRREFEAIQFRSIFEGLPVIELAGAAKLVFEVNGLPSIELKYRYPGMEDDRELMRKILTQEQACLEGTSVIVTPSCVTANYLASERRVPVERIQVVPNGVDHNVFVQERATGTSPVFRMIYFGTLAPWQGVELAIRALAQVRAVRAVTFTIIGSGNRSEVNALMSLAAKLGVGEAVSFLPAMPQAELAKRVATADAVIAPLTLNDRNVVQGCCPLKVLEGMAAGIPVIASDLPVVRELGCDGEHFLLVKPGSVDQIAQAVLRLAEDRELCSKIGEQARRHMLENFTWERAGERLAAVYGSMGISRSRMS